jgi:eukaryotic-like serine/threonine-protein kinase
MNRLGKYQIRRTLGQGAMGIVYEGFDPAIERTVAIKTILPSQVAGADFATLLARFKREAQAAGRLNHPGIVAIYDYGEELAQDISEEEATIMAPAGATHAAAAQRVAYIAMEFVRGRELKEALAQGERFALPAIVNVMGQVLEALDHAHANGVVHRDIKPANLILLPDGRVKIADFGIARIEASELTQTGAVLGTPSYMSPEQFTGQPVDGRSDLFSCGVILYQMLTGERPFTGESTTTIMYKVLREEPPPPSQLNVSLPPALDAVLRQALAKAPAQRFATGHDFAQALQAAAAQAQQPAAAAAQAVPATAVAPAASPASPRPRRALAWAAGGATALVVVLAGAYVLFAQQRGAGAPPQVAAGVATSAAVSTPAPALAPVPAVAAPSTAAAPPPGTVVISALGVADPQDPQFKGDAAAVQRQALEAAHRHVIEKALALWLEPASMDRHRALIERKLMANSGAFIRTVLQEGPADGARSGLVEEQTRAVVSLRDLQRSLNDLSRDERVEFIRRQGDPRISIRIDVAGAGGPMARERSQLAENVLKERIRSFGFRVWAADGENAAAAAQPADFAIQGEVKLKQLSMRLPASGLTITKAALTSWTLKAVQSATGEEVYVSTRLPTGKTWVDEDHALADIGKLVGDEFSRQFFLRNFMGRPQKATLMFTGLPEGAAPLMLRELRATRAVLDAQPQGEPARFEVLLAEGNASDLVRDAIVRPLNAKLRVECLTMTGGTPNQLTIGYAASCAGADLRTRLESGAPAGLPAPPPRPSAAPPRNTA